MRIVMQPSGVYFYWNSTKKYLVPFGMITGVEITTGPFPSRLVVSILQDSRTALPSNIVVDFDQVAIPSTLNATALKAAIITYNLGYENAERFIATTSQTDFPIVHTLTGYETVYVSGVLKTLTSDYTINTVTNEVVFGSAMSGGEEIVVADFRSY